MLEWIIGIVVSVIWMGIVFAGWIKHSYCTDLLFELKGEEALIYKIMDEVHGELVSTKFNGETSIIFHVTPRLGYTVLDRAKAYGVKVKTL